MKKLQKGLGILACAILAHALANAAVILQDSFDYADGSLTNVSNGKWVVHSGNLTGMFVVGGELQVSGSLADDCNAALTGGPYGATSETAALYARFRMRVTSLPSSTGSYFAHFKDSSTGFRARVFVNTANAPSGYYRVGLANNASSASVQFPQDLLPNNTYTVVVRYVPQTGVSTLWIDPANETSQSVTATDTPSTASIVQFAFRQATGIGTVMVDDLVVGTTFADVVPSSAGSNPPFVVVQPADTNVSEGVTVSFTTLACGDEPLSYQWYFNTNTPLPGATARVLTLPNVTAAQAGTYHAEISNIAGVTITRFASLTVQTTPVPPVITNQPADQTVTIGDPAQFSVLAGGSPPLTYLWFSVIDGATNRVGGNAPTYTISATTPAQAGQYFVVVTNIYGAVTSRLATLTVNPPVLTNIAYVRSLIDRTTYAPTNTTRLFRVRGIVTSKASLTSAANTLFYMQDETAGIAVYWTAAPGETYCPPQGALVEVVAPVTSFNGLLELAPSRTNPLHSVTVLSTGNPLPEPIPLPFDPAIVSDPAVMDALEGRYVVATNVTLDQSSAVFQSVSAGEQITNALGQTFTMYINAYTDIVGRRKPTTPVNIYGVLGQYDNSSPYTSGYQLIPTAYSDFVGPIQYQHVLENLWRPNGQPTNDMPDNPVRPGEKLTTYVSARDLAGGTCTLTPITVGLPPGASWSTGPVSGQNPSTTFTFTPSQALAGSNVIYTVVVTTPSATYTQSWAAYVPNATEQQVFISEFLANPTTNTSAPHFNPLRRDLPSTNAVVQDEYIEIVNLSDNVVDLYNWSVEDAITVRHVFYNGSWSGEAIQPKSAIVVYGGPLNGYWPQLSVSAFPANQSTTAGLALNNSGTEVITIRNENGYPVDRVFYTGSDLSTSGSLTRFPTDRGAFVPQPYVSTNPVSPGMQYAGNDWAQPPVMPTGVRGITLVYGNPVRLQFTNDPARVTTLWAADEVTNMFRVVFGQQFPAGAGEFYVTNPPATRQFYFITQQ